MATPAKCECAEAAAGTEDRQDNGQTGPHCAAWLLAAAGGGGTELNILRLFGNVTAACPHFSPSRNPHVGISRPASPAPARLLLLLGQALVDNIAEFLP